MNVNAANNLGGPAAGGAVGASVRAGAWRPLARVAWGDAPGVLGGAVVYAVLGWCSLRLALTQAHASAVWPLSGLAIGVLTRWGIRWWPAVFLGALAANVLVGRGIGEPAAAALLSAVGIAVGNTLEAVVGARLVRRALGEEAELVHAPGVFRFVVAAAVVPPAISAACGVLSLWVTGGLPAEKAAYTALTWFTGNAAGIIGLAPLLLVGPWRVRTQRWTAAAVAERAVLLALLAFVGQTICGVYFAAALREWPRSYMAIPLVLWAAGRLGRHETVLAGLGLLAVGVAGTLRGYEAFPAGSPEQSLLSLQLFISTVVVIGLTVAAAMHQVRAQRRALEELVLEKSSRLASVEQERTVFMASAIHDLQSPLSGIHNLLQLVRRRPTMMFGPERDTLLAEMQGATGRMLTLVSAAVAAQRAEAGLQALEDGFCDLPALVRRLVESERAHASAKGVALRLREPFAPGSVPVGGTSLGHIVGNFLSNAVKFSAPGATVWVAIERSGLRVSIRVEDEGPGLTALERRQIFSRPRGPGRARPTAGEPSNGLGLFLVGRLAERIGATLSCEAARGGGSIFTVTLDQGRQDGAPVPSSNNAP